MKTVSCLRLIASSLGGTRLVGAWSCNLNRLGPLLEWRESSWIASTSSLAGEWSRIGCQRLRPVRLEDERVSNWRDRWILDQQGAQGRQSRPLTAGRDPWAFLFLLTKQDQSFARSCWTFYWGRYDSSSDKMWIFRSCSWYRLAQHWPNHYPRAPCYDSAISV